MNWKSITSGEKLGKIAFGMNKMDFNWKKFSEIVNRAERYAAKASVPKNLKFVERDIKDLKRLGAELREYDLFQTAGAYQKYVMNALKDYDKALNNLKRVLDYYKRTSGNGRQETWNREFYRVGENKDSEDEEMKLTRKKIDEERDQKTDIPSMLRSLACDEIVSYHAYITAAKNIRGENWADVKQEFEQHAKTELEHFESILDRMYQIGQPVHSIFNTIQECAGYYWDVDTEDPREACEIAKKAEDAAVEGYRKLLIAIADSPLEERDFGTQRLAKKHLEAEQDHVQDMIHLLEEFK